MAKFPIPLLAKPPESRREQLLRSLAEDQQFPSLGAAIAKVIAITSSGDESVEHLAHFILSDVGLTQKILRLANTVQYRSSVGAPVTTVTRAIFLLGFDTVKQSALRMLFVGCIQNREQARNVRQELLQALCASILGRVLAQRSRAQDAELAAVAALFKNLGRVLIATFDHALYTRILELAQQSEANLAQADTSLLGCSFERFGELALADWKIPETIVHALAALPSSELKKSPHRSDWLRQVASCSAALAQAMLNGQDASYDIIKRYGKALDIERTDLQPLLQRAEREMSELASSIDLPLPIMRSELVFEPEALPAAFFMTTALSNATPERFASGKPCNARDLLLAGVQDAAQMLARGHFQLNDLLLLILETLYSSMGFRFVTICLREMDSARYAARLAVGEAYAERQRAFQFGAESGVFTLAMTHNADLVIADTSESKVNQLLPDWHKMLLPDTRSFLILPLVIEKRPVGLVYADRAHIAPEGVPADESALIRTLRSQLLAALVHA